MIIVSSISRYPVPIVPNDIVLITVEIVRMLELCDKEKSKRITNSLAFFVDFQVLFQINLLSHYYLVLLHY